MDLRRARPEIIARLAVMLRRTVALLLLAAGACPAQDAAFQADARAVAEKEIAMVKLQQMQTRPNGSQQTREQDRIDQDVAADYQFIQDHRARWSASAETKAAFDSAVRAAVRDPALRNEDPFKVSEAKPPAPRVHSSGDGVIDWGQVAFAAAFLTALVFAACFLVLRGTIFGLWVISKVAPHRLAGGGSAGPLPSFPQSGSGPSGDGGWGRVCPACNGARNVPCQLCSAGGQRDGGVCNSCFGQRSRPCGTCGGTGRVNW